MQKIGRWKRLGFVLVVLSSLAACGQKGNLYLPDGHSLTHWIG